MDQVTHKQHYVWRSYLRPWCECKDLKKGVYFIWWNNKKVHRFTDVFDILREVDYYQLKPLNKIERYLLEKLFAVSKQKEVIEANRPFINLADLISLVAQNINSKSGEFEDMQIEFGEKIQSENEKFGISCIQKLQSGTFPWSEDEAHRVDFVIFLCTQYFRTKTMKDNLVRTMSDESEEIIRQYKSAFNDPNDYLIDWDKIYNYGHLCLANSASYNLLAKGIHFKLLHSSNARFIVSDQPVYNIGVDSIGEFTLFYPISPKLALLGSVGFEKDESIDVDDKTVLQYNDATLKHSYRFFMGKEERDVNFTFPY